MPNHPPADGLLPVILYNRLQELSTELGTAMFAVPAVIALLIQCRIPDIVVVYDCLRVGENRFPPRSRPTQPIPP